MGPWRYQIYRTQPPPGLLDLVHLFLGLLRMQQCLRSLFHELTSAPQIVNKKREALPGRQDELDHQSTSEIYPLHGWKGEWTGHRSHTILLKLILLQRMMGKDLEGWYQLTFPSSCD